MNYSYPPHPVLGVLTGPAGVGKNTACDRLLLEDPSFARVITCTTRDPRAGEINGKDYHFFDPSVFDGLVASRKFLEWAYVHGKEGDKKRMYGTLKDSVLPVLRAGQNLIIHIEVRGAAAFREYALSDPFFSNCLHTIFMHAPMDVLENRMRSRFGNNALTPTQEADIASRLETAKQEMEEIPKFDSVIPNGTKDEVFKAVLAVIRRHQASLTLKLSQR